MFISESNNNNEKTTVNSECARVASVLHLNAKKKHCFRFGSFKHQQHHHHSAVCIFMIFVFIPIRSVCSWSLEATAKGPVVTSREIHERTM